MDRFVKKSAVKSLKRQNSDKEYDKEYDGKKRKRNFQSSWLAEFPWLTLDKDRGIMKCSLHVKKRLLDFICTCSNCIHPLKQH